MPILYLKIENKSVKTDISEDKIDNVCTKIDNYSNNQSNFKSKMIQNFYFKNVTVIHNIWECNERKTSKDQPLLTFPFTIHQ